MGLGKLFGKGAGEAADKVIGSIGSAVDGLVTSEEEKLKLKNELSKIVLDGYAQVAKEQKDVLVKEIDGNFLQKSWRPLLMLTFGVIVVIAVFYDVKLNSVPEEFWGLLQIGIGGYIGGRSLEKITDKVTKNMDLSLLKKKERKQGV